MKIIRTELFKRGYKKLPGKVKKQTDKALQLLIANLSHPSLRVKKIKSRENIWEARVSTGYRLSFEIKGEACILRSIGKREEVLKKP